MRTERVSEKALQAQIVRALRSVGAAVYTIGRPPRRDAVHKGTGQTPGIPDLLVHLPALAHYRVPAHAVWVEVKAAGGRLSEAQQGFREFCQQAGIPHVVGGLDEVLAYLVERGYVREVAHYRCGGSLTPSMSGSASR